MGLRRRRKKLTSIITNVDKRLRSVEFRHVPTRIKASSITTEQIADGVVPSDDPKDAGATGSIASDTSPVEFKLLVSATYQAKNVTGSVDRVDIVTTSPHGLLVGEKVSIYGLNNNDVNLDGSYVITEVPSTTEFRFSRGLTGYYQSAVSLSVKATVTYKSCTLTEASLTLSTAAHGFVVGDVITVTGVDDTFNGTFFISAIDGAIVKYKFLQAVTETVLTTAASGFVNASVHKYTIIGDTWIDTSVTPNVYKVWDGLSWTSPSNIPEGLIINDGIAPSAPTNLSAITSGYYDPTSGAPNVAVTLSWDAPTTNSNGTPLTDLGGYRVFYKYNNVSVAGEDNGSVGVEPPGQLTTPGSPASADATLSGVFTWNNTLTSTVPAISLSTSIGSINVSLISAIKGNKSVLWTVKGLTDGDNVTVSWASSSSNKYGAGSVSTELGTNVYTYSATPPTTGFSISGAIKATSQTKSTSAATPEITTDIATTTEVAPASQWISAGDTDQLTMSMRDFRVASTIEFAVQAVDSSKLNFSEYSASLTIETGSPAIILNAPSTPTVEARLGTVTVSWDGYDEEGLQPPPYLSYVEVHLGTTSGFTPGISTVKGRMEPLGENSLVVVNLVYGTTYYAKLIFYSSTGAATAPSAASTGATVVALVDTDVIGKVLSGAKIVDGSITASDAIIGNTITGNLIQSNTIEAGSIKANSITADQILAGSIDALSLSATAIDGKTITGATVRTGSSGARVVMDTSGLRAYNASNAQTFNIDNSTGTVTVGGYATTSDLSGKISTGNAANDVNTYSTTISGGKITTGTIDATRILVTDTFTYSNGLSGGSLEEARLGQNAIPSISSTPGLALTAGGAVAGWVGAWGGGSLELGTSFNDNYIDMHQASNTRNDRSSGGIDMIGATSDLDVGYYSAGAINAFAAFRVNSDSTAGTRLLDTNGNIGVSVSHRVGGTVGYFRTNLTSGGSTRVTLQSDGNITCVSLTQTSSRRFKTDIEDYPVSSHLLDIPIVKFKYDYSKMGYGYEGISEPMVGVIAEDLIDLGFSDLILFDEENPELPNSVDYAKLAVMLIPIVKNLKLELDNLKTKVDGL